ncbi:MAG: nucleotide pyrophosphohydrolase [Actinobacteria bacterium]|nr:nucleotide pyrophosphohydrolase [Actinomycetota bacterium]
MDITSFQRMIADIYLDRDGRRGTWETYAWLVEEVGELARALRSGDEESLREEFADVFAWLASLANLRGIDLAEAAGKYAGGCPKCLRTPCSCPEA